MAKQSWLIKSEPFKYPFSKLVSDGRTTWDGVRNFEARNSLRAMKKGDTLLFYHSSEGKEIVGLARVAREAYPDPSSDEDWSAIDVEPVRALPHPVTLATIKAHRTLKDMMIVRRPRISVVPVTREELDTVLELSKASK
jgi:predicted RNA-binding protein with PUA-like domain